MLSFVQKNETRKTHKNGKLVKATGLPLKQNLNL
jgi:hypothetical protein